MMKSALALALAAALLVDMVRAHGYMTVPTTRAQIALDNGKDYCPWCSSLWDVGAGEGLDPYQGRPFPGGRPFAEPGASAPLLGPCAGRGSGGTHDYNYPGQEWGFEVVDTFEEGEVVRVEWLPNADHRGVYSYRVCQNQTIVDRFINPDYIPSTADYFLAEECFQAGILPCNAEGLGNTNCATSASQTFGCNDPSWGCADAPEWFGIFDVQDPYVDYVRMPSGYTAARTLLTWRWDVHDTQQIYFSCADISILAGDGATEATTTQAATTTTAQAGTTTTQTATTTTAPAATNAPMTGDCPDYAEAISALSDVVVALQAEVNALNGRTCVV